MAGQGDIVNRVLNRLYSLEPTGRPFLHQINGAIDGTTQTIVVDDGTNFVAGDVIEFDTDGEQCFITTVATNTLTVVRGFNGTTGAAQADNSFIWKNPKYTHAEAIQAITDVIADMNRRGLYFWNTAKVTLVSQQTFYDVTVSDIKNEPGVVSVYYPADTSLEPVAVPFKWYDNLHASFTTSGRGLHLWHWGDRIATEDLYYTYSAFHNAVDDVTTRQEEILILGCIINLMGGRVAQRIQDPGARTDRTVQPGQEARDVRHYQAEYLRAVWAEQAYLRQDLKNVPTTPRLTRMRRWRP